MDVRHIWILLTGVASLVVGVRGLHLVTSPRNERDREVHGKLTAYGLLCVSGGVLLTGYALLT